MPKLAIPLTETQIAALEPKSIRYKVADGSGLHLMVQPTGTKSWRMGFRFLGKEKAISFGQYPEISLKDARQLCLDTRRLITQGIDPVLLQRERHEQAMAARPITSKFQLRINDQGEMVIENSSRRLTLTVKQVAALRAFLIATSPEIQGA